MRPFHTPYPPLVFIVIILMLSLPASAQDIEEHRPLPRADEPRQPQHHRDDDGPGSHPLVQDTMPVYHRPKIALVLSGGGAKGCAHVGVLKALEQFNIPVDMILGTSMGALIGGLYSIGYGADQIDSLLQVQNWNQLLFDQQDPSIMSLSQRRMSNKFFYAMTLKNWQTLHFGSQGIVKGNNLDNLFAQLTMGFHDSVSFDSLPIPFTCVATDLVHDRQYNFRSGKLATAMRASMAIPGVFSPVIMDGMVLADGGMKDNFPADLARQQGADIVIGVSVKNEKERTVDDFKGTVDVLSTIIEGLTEAKYAENIPLADMYIHVNVEGFSTMSFNREAIGTLVNRGYMAVINQLDTLLEIKRRADPYDIYKFVDLPKRTIIKSTDRLPLRQIEMNNVYSFDSLRLARRFHILNNDSITINEIEKIVGSLRSNLCYVNPSYSLMPCRNAMLRMPGDTVDHYGYALSLTTDGKQAARIYLGVRYDNVENVAMMLHGLIPLHWNRAPIVLESTLRLGTNQDVSLAASLSPFTMGKMQLSYGYRHRQFNIYHNGKRTYNADFYMHEIDFGIKDGGLKNMLFDAFVRMNVANRDELLQLRDNPLGLQNVMESALVSYHFDIHFNNQDNNRLATHGIDFMANYACYTDNFYQYLSAPPVHTFQLHLQKAFPMWHHLTFEPMLYGRIVKGDSIPVLLRNYVGGEYYGHLIDQVAPFAGISHTETIGSHFLGIETEMRYNPMHNHYFIVTAAAGIHHDDFYKLLTNKPLVGMRLAYNYSTLIGPIGLSINYSNICHLSMYLNIGFEF